MNLRKDLRTSRRYLLHKRREALARHAVRHARPGEAIMVEGVYCHLYAPAHVQRVMAGADPVRPVLISNGTGRKIG